MIKSELIDQLLRQQSYLDEKVVQRCVDTLLDKLSEYLILGHRVEIRNFGNFVLRTRRSHVGRDPRTGKSLSIASRKVVFFKPGKKMKACILASKHIPIKKKRGKKNSS